MQVTAVELNPKIASIYQDFFPEDTVIIADAHQYLLEHFEEFDFIWSSPPCPTHSRVRTMQKVIVYPDMALYQEIILLKHFYNGKFCIENVIGYYDPLIRPSAELERHYFWTNFFVPDFKSGRDFDVSEATKETLAEYHGVHLPPDTQDQRKILRNAVYPPLGLHIFNHSMKDEHADLFRKTA